MVIDRVTEVLMERVDMTHQFTSAAGNYKKRRHTGGRRDVTSSHAVGGRAHVVNLEDHLDQLGGQHDLLLLAVQRLDHVLLLHV